MRHRIHRGRVEDGRGRHLDQDPKGKNPTRSGGKNSTKSLLPETLVVVTRCQVVNNAGLVGGSDWLVKSDGGPAPFKWQHGAVRHASCLSSSYRCPGPRLAIPMGRHQTIEEQLRLQDSTSPPRTKAMRNHNGQARNRLGYLWNLVPDFALPTENATLRAILQMRGLGGGITWAWDDHLCDKLLPIFSEDIPMFPSLVDCPALKAAVARAFNAWSANNRWLRFQDVTEECRRLGMNFYSEDHRGPLPDNRRVSDLFGFHGGCPLAEIWVTDLKSTSNAYEEVAVATATTEARVTVISDCDDSSCKADSERASKRRHGRPTSRRGVRWDIEHRRGWQDRSVDLVGTSTPSSAPAFIDSRPSNCRQRPEPSSRPSVGPSRLPRSSTSA